MRSRAQTIGSRASRHYSCAENASVDLAREDRPASSRSIRHVPRPSGPLPGPRRSLTAPIHAPTLAALLVLAFADLADAVKRETGSEVLEKKQDEPTCAAPATVSDRNASCKSSLARFCNRAREFSSRRVHDPTHCKKRVDATALIAREGRTMCRQPGYRPELDAPVA